MDTKFHTEVLNAAKTISYYYAKNKIFVTFLCSIENNKVIFKAKTSNLSWNTEAARELQKEFEHYIKKYIKQQRSKVYIDMEDLIYIVSMMRIQGLIGVDDYVEN